MRNYVAVAPRGLPLHSSGRQARREYGWRQQTGQIAKAEQHVFECIDLACERFHISPRRVFLAGFDCGGTMCFRLAMNHPQRFAGALSLGGLFPHGRTPLANLSEARRVPLFLAFGQHSQACPPAEVCRDLKLLHCGCWPTWIVGSWSRSAPRQTRVDTRPRFRVFTPRLSPD
jgi:phospholipase/carboxylesterase